TLFLRGRLDTPESHAAGEAPVAPAGEMGAASVGAANAPQAAGVTRPGGAGRARGAAGRWGTAAAAGLVAGAGLLVFTDAPWTHVLGVLGLLLCAVSVFALSVAPPDR